MAGNQDEDRRRYLRRGTLALLVVGVAVALTATATAAEGAGGGEGTDSTGAETDDESPTPTDVGATGRAAGSPTGGETATSDGNDTVETAAGDRPTDADRSGGDTDGSPSADDGVRRDTETRDQAVDTAVETTGVPDRQPTATDAEGGTARAGTEADATRRTPASPVVTDPGSGLPGGGGLVVAGVFVLMGAAELVLLWLQQ